MSLSLRVATLLQAPDAGVQAALEQFARAGPTEPVTPAELSSPGSADLILGWLEDLLPLAPTLRPVPEMAAALEPELAGMLPAVLSDRCAPLRLDFRLLYYRADLLLDRREQRAFEEATERPLPVPEGWADLAAVAQFFARPPHLGGFTFPGAGRDLVRFFHQVVCSLGGRLVDEEGRPWLRAAAPETAARLLYDLHVRWHATPADTLEMEQAEVSRRFRLAGAAMALDGPAGFERALDPTFSAVGGWLGLAPVPGTAAGAGAALPRVLAAAIPSAGAADDTAQGFVRWLLSDEGQASLAVEGGVPVTSAARAAVEGALRVGTIAQQRWRLLAEATARTARPLPVLDGPRWERALGIPLRQMLAGALSPGPALAQAEQELRIGE